MELEAGDITLIDASRPCSIFWQHTSKQASLLLPRQLVESQLHGGDISIATRLNKTAARWSSSASGCCKKVTQPGDSQKANGEAALEAIICLLRPMLLQQDAPPTRRDKQFQKIMALIDESIQSEQLRPEWLAGNRHVGTQPVPPVCR